MSDTQAAQALRITHVADLDEWVAELAWSPHGDQVACAVADGRVVMLDAATGAIREVARHEAPATHVAWSPDGRLASAGQDGLVKIAGSTITLPGTPWPQALAWRPDGARIAVAAHRHVRLYDPDGAHLAVSAPLEATVSCAQWLPRGVGLAAGSYGGVRILHGADLRPDKALRWKGSVLALAISPDGRRLAHGNQDASVHFWDLRKRTELEMWGYETKVRELAWRRDGQLLASGGGTAVTVWSFAGRGPAGSKPLELEQHDQPLAWIGFAPRGELLASVALDGLVALWRPPRRQPVAVVAIDDALTCGYFSPDGTRLAVAGTDGTAAILTLT